MAEFYSFRRIRSVMKLFCTEVVRGVQMDHGFFLIDCSNEFSSTLIQRKLKLSVFDSVMCTCVKLFFVLLRVKECTDIFIVSPVVNSVALNELENFVHFKRGSL